MDTLLVRDPRSDTGVSFIFWIALTPVGSRFKSGRRDNAFQIWHCGLWRMVGIPSRRSPKGTQVSGLLGKTLHPPARTMKEQ